MDRFIVFFSHFNTSKKNNLKSNMDRFIDSSKGCTPFLMMYLKSNMDRFIGQLAEAAVQ